MSVLYRAIWSDKVNGNAEEAVEAQLEQVASWIQASTTPDPLSEGQTHLSVAGRDRTALLRRVEPAAFEVTVADQSPGDDTDWTTTIRIVAHDGRVHALVENAMQSDDVTKRVSVGRPRIVHDLLTAADKPCLNGSPVLTAAQALPANGITILTDLLADPHRTLPVIVCSEPPGAHKGEWLDRATKIATRTEGVALVVTLDWAAVTEFRRAIDRLAIWGGGIRIYAPGTVVAESDGWRHRYFLHQRLEDAPQPTIDRIVYAVAQLSTRRRVPEVFAVFSEQAGLPAQAEGSTVPAERLEEEREQWEFAMDLALEERSEVEKELAHAIGHLARLKEELVAQGLTDLLWGTQHEPGTSIPDEVQDASEAALAAQTYLSQWLAVPDSAIRELEDVDTAPTAFAWGNRTWGGLRALAAYAQDRAGGWDNGGFWEWCASGPLLGWPATPKKLAMTEGETVQNNEKLRRARVFKVDPAADPAGEITMLAHLKVSEGGGPLAPRIYFHDDTGGATGKVHVGLIGPHSLVPNKSTN
jgi:hypothetical protein